MAIMAFIERDAKLKSRWFSSRPGVQKQLMARAALPLLAGKQNELAADASHAPKRWQLLP